MIIGDRNVYAVECEITSQIDSWVYGSFRLWVGGEAIGTNSIQTLNLAATTGVLRTSPRTASSQATQLQAAEFLARVFEPSYGKSGYNHDEWSQWGGYAWVAYCEGFESVFSVAAVVGNHVRVVWRLTDHGQVNEYYVPVTVYSSVNAEFISWLDREMEVRRRGIQ